MVQIQKDMLQIVEMLNIVVPEQRILKHCTGIFGELYVESGGRAFPAILEESTTDAGHLKGFIIVFHKDRKVLFEEIVICHARTVAFL